VGQLAAGVAHEIGNPISSVLGYTELLLAGGTGEEAQDSLRRIRGEVERIDRIVRGLLDFARPLPRQLEDIEVNPLIDEAAELARHRKGVRHKVRFERRLAEGLPKVRADRAQLVQVLVNLMLNGVDAMPEGGELRLATRLVEPPPEELEAVFGQAFGGQAFGGHGSGGPARRRDDPPGADFSRLRAAPAAPAPRGPARFVEVEVADTGCGIAAEKLSRVFDPFYTTKPPGAGTGLGLAISLRIVRSFGGAIRVSSRLGEGSRFQVLLPVGREDGAGD
jgi:two-component system NtrC family sensor kinase